jgi:hypothetical protein
LKSAPLPFVRRKPSPKSTQPADLVREWIPLVRDIDRFAEIDFSYRDDAITICDMRAPAALRWGILYRRHELQDNLYKIQGDLERRVKEFMR